MIGSSLTPIWLYPAALRFSEMRLLIWVISRLTLMSHCSREVHYPLSPLSLEIGDRLQSRPQKLDRQIKSLSGIQFFIWCREILFGNETGGKRRSWQIPSEKFFSWSLEMTPNFFFTRLVVSRIWESVSASKKARRENWEKERKEGNRKKEKNWVTLI